MTLTLEEKQDRIRAKLMKKWGKYLEVSSSEIHWKDIAYKELSGKQLRKIYDDFHSIGINIIISYILVPALIERIEKLERRKG